MRNKYFTSTGQIAVALRALADDLVAAGPVEVPNTQVVIDVMVAAQTPLTEQDRIGASRTLGAALGVPVAEHGQPGGFRHHGTPGQRRYGCEVSVYVPLTTSTGKPLRAAA